MSQTLFCPACQHHLEVRVVPPPGTRVRCFQCKNVFTVGESSRPAPAAPTPAPFAPAPAPVYAPQPQTPAAGAYAQQFVPPQPFAPATSAPAHQPNPFARPVIPASQRPRASNPAARHWAIVVGVVGGMLVAAVLIGLMLRSYLDEREERLAGDAAATAGPVSPPTTPDGPAPTTPVGVELPAAAPRSPAGPPPATPAALTYRPAVGYNYPYAFNIDIKPPWTPGTTMKCQGSISFTARKVEEAEVARLLSGVGASRDAADLTDLRNASVLDAWGSYADDGYLEGVNRHPIKATALTSATAGLVASADDTAMPLMLGNVCGLPFDKLPRTGETTWEVQSESPLQMPTRLGRNDRLGMVGLERNRFQRPGALASITAVVKERINYRLGERRENLQIIHKQQHLQAYQNGSVSPVLSFHGEGTIEFDLAQGMPTKCEMKFSLSGERDGQMLIVPVTVRYDLLKVELQADINASVDDYLDSRTKSSVAQKPPTAEETQQVQEFLQWAKQPNAVDEGLGAVDISLLRAIAVYQPEVSTALDRFVNESDLRKQPFVLRALEQWGTAANIPRLLALIESDRPTWNEKTGVYEAVGYISSREPQAAQTALPVLVSRLRIKDESNSAKSALILIGPAAEPLVLQELDRLQGQELGRAVGVLAEVGTEKSLPALTALSKDDKRSFFTTVAISQIKKRAAAKSGS